MIVATHILLNMKNATVVSGMSSSVHDGAQDGDRLFGIFQEVVK
jgi:hypothetical protein